MRKRLHEFRERRIKAFEQGEIITAGDLHDYHSEPKAKNLPIAPYEQADASLRSA